MKKFAILILMFCILPYALAGEGVNIKINRIYDGDTIEACIDNNTFSIRLYGIDCFETSNINRAYKQAYLYNMSINDVQERGLNSKIYLDNLYNENTDKDIKFIFKGIDKYGRALGILYFGQKNVNENMIHNGGCYHFEYKEK